MIELNITLIFQVVGFFILLLLMNTWLYRPIQKILQERDERINGSIKKAAEIEKDVETGIADYEKRLKDAAVKGHEERNKLRQTALDREKEVLEAARVKASASIASMRQELEASKASAISTLKNESKAISKNIAEKILERSVVVLLIALGVILAPEFGWASPSGGEGHGGGVGSTWKIINFVILVIGVYLVWTKAIKGLLEKRGNDIKKALEEAQAARDIAERKAAEYKEKLNTLDRRISEIHNELRLEGEAEQKKILAEAEIAAVKLQEQAKLAAEQEIKKARLEIRKEVAELAVGMAEEILRKEIKKEDQERLVKGYLNNLRLN